MFGFDDLPKTHAKQRQASMPTSIAIQLEEDAIVGRECFDGIGKDAALSLLGALLRDHRKYEYRNYLQAALGKSLVDSNAQSGNSMQAENSLAESTHLDEVTLQQKSIPEESSLEAVETKHINEVDATLPRQHENSVEAVEATNPSETEASRPPESLQQESSIEAAETNTSPAIPVDTPEKETIEFNVSPQIVLKDRALAHLTRWETNTEEADSGDEAESTLSSLGRTLSLFSSVVGIGFTMALSSDPTAAGKQIAQMCRDQGGIYVKAAQTASAMQYAFTDEVIKEFESLQDQANPQDWSELEPRVAQHTPGGIDFIYESFAHEAINAASIAQVHVARRRSGEKVAVKILRRRIESTFNKDVSNYLGLLGAYETATGISIKWMQEWVMQELKKEIDFRYEASRHEEACDFISKHQELIGKICVPTLHAELCTKRLLVTEFVDGCKITQAPVVFADDWNKERDLPQLFDTLETWGAMQVFLWGKFHGDPHPGNVLVRRKTKSVPRGETPFEIVVIDHGGYYELSPATRQAYAELWLMMDKPIDEKHRLQRKARAKEILDAWGVGHHSRYVIEQMLGGHFGTADPTSDVKENGQARMHRYNLMNQNGKDYGPEMFSDTTKMPPELMKAQGAATFMMGIWNQLAQKFPGWNAPERRRAIMMKWAAQSPGVRRPP